MKAVLESIDWWERNKEEYPVSEYGVYASLTISVGTEGVDGEDLFYLVVMDLKCLSRTETLPRMGKGLMIVKDYNRDVITQKIKECIAECDTGEGESTALNLSRYFDWEFENYKPYIPETEA